MNIFTGMLGAIGANEGQKLVNEHVHQSPDHEDLFHKLHATICEILEDIHVIAGHFKALKEPPIDRRVTLQTTRRIPIVLRGRRHSMIFVGNNTTQIQASIPGLGDVAFTPPVGWTALDFEDGTELSLVTGNATTVILRVGNVSLGANAL